MDKNKSGPDYMTEFEYQHAKRGHGGKGSGIKSRRTRRRQEKIQEEEHAMDKPKPLEEVSDGDLSEIKKDPVWKTWLDNITKPIPDSKGGKGSFQHCINANQDKHNPGGWCKQIERKIGKAKKQTNIDKPKDWWDHSKVGRNTGWEDDPMNKPSYFQARMEEERKKREKKKAKKKEYPIPVNVFLEETHSRIKIPSDGKKKGDKIEEPESDYYMDAGGNPQRKEKTDYFVEEIRANIIYHNKIFPIVGMIAGQAARGMGKMGKKVGGEILEGASEIGQGMMQQEEEEEQ